MRSLIIALVVLAVVVVGADFAGRTLAEQRAGDAISENLPGDSTVTVDIHGFSFLLQAIRGDYSDVTIDTDDVTIDDLSGITVQADLNNVQLSIADALSGDFTNLSADGATVHASIPISALAASLGRSGVTITPRGSTTADVTSTDAIAGRTFTVTTRITISATSQQLRMSATPLPSQNQDVPARVLDAIAGGLSKSYPLDSLPYTLTDPDVSFDGSEITLRGSVGPIDATQLNLTAAPGPPR